eukprot:TRINITY_DN17123_c0_g1_i1.p1 TRINITY_DN17123_c0_g1~~TRINITY_DN17123_c0_g1_i1.p1  ORF type:complete len:221 (+),score=28.08 TRINITY_DN17123_c0_g1_i1:376-1038(+)
MSKGSNREQVPLLEATHGTLGSRLMTPRPVARATAACRPAMLAGSSHSTTGSNSSLANAREPRPAGAAKMGRSHRSSLEGGRESNRSEVSRSTASKVSSTGSLRSAKVSASRSSITSSSSRLPARASPKIPTAGRRIPDDLQPLGMSSARKTSLDDKERIAHVSQESPRSLFCKQRKQPMVGQSCYIDSFSPRGERRFSFKPAGGGEKRPQELFLDFDSF